MRWCSWAILFMILQKLTVNNLRKCGYGVKLVVWVTVAMVRE